jgi:hypothetical protein
MPETEMRGGMGVQVCESRLCHRGARTREQQKYTRQRCSRPRHSGPPLQSERDYYAISVHPKQRFSHSTGLARPERRAAAERLSARAAGLSTDPVELPHEALTPRRALLIAERRVYGLSSTIQSLTIPSPLLEASQKEAASRCDLDASNPHLTHTTRCNDCMS